MKKVNILLLFFLVAGAVWGQSGNAVKQQPSTYQLALAFLPKIKSFNVKDPEQLARKVLTEDSLALTIAKLTRFDQQNYLLWSLTGSYFDDHSTLTRILDRTIFTYKRLNFKYGELWLRKEQADLHLREGKMKLAEQELRSLIKEFEQTNFPDLPQYYDLLAGVYLNENDTKNALSTAFETLKHLRFASDSLKLPNFYLRLASVYNILGNRKTLDWIIKIYDYYIATNRPYAFYPYLKNYASISTKWNTDNEKKGLQFIMDFHDKYPPRNDAEKNNFYLAATILNVALGQKTKADSLYKKHMDIVGSADKLSLETGVYLYNSGRYTEARKHLIYALEHPAQGYPFLKLSGIYKTLYYIDSLQKNYLSAMHFANRHDALKDSMFNVAKNKQIEELQITYETAQKQKDMDLMREKEKLQKIKLSQTENTRNLMIGGSVMLLLLLGISYNGYRQKQKSNQLFLQKNEMLQRLIREKEWLLKEVHHRVKNNLHTVICLLESQAAYLENDALLAIETSQHRIYAMSLIHQKLYQSDEIKFIDMSSYVPEFVNYLKDSFGSDKRIIFDLQIEKILLGPVQAIPLGLIINETVTNSIKYAFKGKLSGTINITLTKDADRGTLIISDDGVGIDLELANHATGSLGLKLIRGLTEDIQGTIGIERDKGTKIFIIFPLEQANINHEVITMSDTNVH
ncbi:MAG: hypothetical protein EON51_01695 [Acinetobacter sp.]|nr:MAG: hypothetical protein EON51_01695 [Acinetobacter sp.]